jgi:alanine racemase
MIPEKSTIYRATRAFVNLGAIYRNIEGVRKKIGPHRHLMAVVKADGYGHGAIPISETAIKAGADWLGVALPEEGQRLRQAGIRVPILVLGPIQPQEAHKVIEADLEQTVHSTHLLKELDGCAARAGRTLNVHLKVDTGMGRIGVFPQEAVSVAKEMKRYDHLNLRGVFSHFATADESDKGYAEHQLKVFDGVLKDLEKNGIEVEIRHIANSAGILDMPHSYYDMVRPGIMIYGFYPSREVKHSVRLEVAMQLVTKVAALKTVPACTFVSYGRTFRTQREKTVVATLPLGYGDGFSRLLSNRWHFLIRGRRVPLIGRVCMDMCMADVTEIDEVGIGDDAIVFGQNPSADEMAEIIGTINYEITCGINKRVPRVYVNQAEKKVSNLSS